MKHLSIPAGFRFGTAEAGVKYKNRKDVALIIADSPASCAAVFTKNAFAAAPVHLSKELMTTSTGLISGVISNSGCANAATGDQGMDDARKMVKLAANATQCSGDFLVCSTGTIGVQLPMEKLESGIQNAVKSAGSTLQHFLDHADAILTTDTCRKVSSVQYTHDGHQVTITGCAKGSGMIHVNMATMLAYVITDAGIDSGLLQQVFTRVVDRTLNCVTVDGDTSTNDTAIILASGKSGAGVDTAEETHQFEKALTELLTNLAKMLARDGEGATHLVSVTVAGLPTFQEARQAAMTVAKSPLVKTAIYGKDANWGRIACALGYSEVEFDPKLTDISLGELALMKDGTPLQFDEATAMTLLSQEEVAIYADLKTGTESATVWTCDLTERYIEINGSYRT